VAGSLTLLGSVLLAVTLWGAVLRWRGRLFYARRFALACALTSPLPFVAILSGWTVTEVGRQPFVVYGQLKTADAISPVAAPAVAGSLALFVIVYSVLLLAFLFYAGRMILRGPQPHEPEQEALTVRPGIASALAAARK